MTPEEIKKRIDCKYGEILEMVSAQDQAKMYIHILLHMLVEKHNENTYLKRRLDACQH